MSCDGNVHNGYCQTPPRVEFFTVTIAALAESPAAPVLVLRADPNRKRVVITVNGVTAVGESAATVMVSGLSTQGIVLVPGPAIGGQNANVSYEMFTTQDIWMLSYQVTPANTVRLMVERYV